MFLLQVIFQAEIANETELFDFDEIVDSLNNKLIRRHPHVFAGASKPLSAKEQTQAWDAIKAQEKNQRILAKLLLIYLHHSPQS